MGTILCSAIVISSLFFPALTLTTVVFAMAISTVHIIHMAQHFHQNRMTYLNVEQPNEKDVINQLKNRLGDLKELTNEMSSSLASEHHKLFKPLDHHEITRMENNRGLSGEDTEEEHESIEAHHDFNQWLQQQYFFFKSIIEQSFISYHHTIHQLTLLTHVAIRPYHLWPLPHVFP